MSEMQPNSLEDDLSQLHAVIDGQVQGVGFRNFVSRQAAKFHLQGWVRNTWQGKVEVLAEGDRQNLEDLLAALQVGPRSAVVQKVDINWKPYTGNFQRFRVAPTV